ncbi:S9 family peptidase [Gallalistipes aquisgranensis]|uniref:S9 family peptidase n=1 Tax=Gallalistipes aquisgranensis TaxID=2779358 RepID=UPI0037447873|nr:S9 family peptidase [Gallalistipes aquisgranensis]
MAGNLKSWLLLSVAVGAMASCGTKTENMTTKIDNGLTPQEKQAGVFTPEVMWKMNRIGSSSLSPDGQSVVYTLTKYDMAENRGRTSLCLSPAAGGDPVVLTEADENVGSPAWSADGGAVWYVSDRSGSDQLWKMDVSSRKAVQVSDIADGIAGFGIAPSGDRAYYLKRVQVEKRRSSDIYPDMGASKARIYDDLMARHWNYWDEGGYMHIFVADLKDGRLTEGKDIMEGEPWDAPMAPYFDGAEIAWNHAGTQLAYTCKKMTGTEYAVSTDSDIYLYDVASAATRNICKGDEEPLDPRLRRMPSMPGYDKYPVFSPDDRKIAFRSMRRPGNESDKERLFVWNSEDGSMSDLTAGFDYNASNVVWNGNDELWFIAPIAATHQICKVPYRPAAGDRPHYDLLEVETVTSGDHDINAFTRAGDRMVAEVTTLSMATELFGVDPSTGEMTRLTAVNGEVYDNVKMGEVRKRWMKTTDGKQMLTWVVLPPDFDSTKRYPALLYCQGGPQSVVSQFWSYRWNLQLMAAQGYVVVAPNRRGLPSFGQEWLDQISGDYSGQNIRDYLSAIDDVASEPWVDEDRLGCVGASYGGYSVFFLAGNHDKRFKAFIAHCGIFDFDSMYGETEELWFVNNDYGGPYWDKGNATAQRSYANSPHKFVEKWDTPILIFTGEKDFRIPYTQSLEAFTAARVRGIPARLVAFEDEAHQVFKPQNSLVWNREFFGWLDKYLKPAGENR